VLRTADGARRPPLPHFFLERYGQSYLAEWAAFIQAVRGGAASPVPGADGRAALVAALAADRSLREQRTVALAEVG
jgi:myo-inositol 2-dehydrogenase/D-chiro-inositol 1-dehydrogenase